MSVSGSITGDFCRMGAMAGRMSGGTMEDCKSSATVMTKTYETDISVGGLVGWQTGGTISNCRNTGRVTAGQSTGGVIGWANGGTQTKLRNSGEVTGTTNVGGVIGCHQQAGAYTMVFEFENTGKVSGKEKVGGVIGTYYNGYSFRSDGSCTAKISRLNNSGDVTGEKQVGGVIGYIYAYATYGSGWNPSMMVTVTGFTADGAVIGKTYVGGMFGYGYSNNSGSVMRGCIMGGTVAAEAIVGGIAGKLENVTLRECNNSDSAVSASGKLTVDNKDYAYLGGYVGYGYSLESCRNSASLTYTLSASHVGGLAGRLSGLAVKNCSNSGVISAGQSDYVGGLAGELSAGENFNLSDLTNTGNVFGNDYTGGLFGRAYAGYNVRSDSTYTSTMMRLTNSGAVSGSRYVAGLMGELVTTAWYNNSWHPSIVISASEWHNSGDVTASDTSSAAGFAVRLETNNSGSKLTNYSSTGLVNGSAGGGNLLFGSTSNFTIAEQS